MDTKRLVREWNNIFNSDCKLKDYSIDTITLFNDFLRLLSKDIVNDDLREDICLITKSSYNYIIYSVEDNKLISKELDVRSKKKFFNYIRNYNYIITNKFPLLSNGLEDKIILRYEVIKNILTSDNSHYFSNELPYPEDNYIPFFTDKLYKYLLKNKFDFVCFASSMLNKFESGITIDDLVLKPNITVSKYGRWYWSNTEKIQNNLRARKKLYSKIIKYANILNIDIISAEPYLVSKLYNSEILKKLVKFRIIVKDKYPEIGELMKNILNVYIHSVDDPVVAYKKVKYKYKKDLVKLEKILNIKILDIFDCLQNDFLCYNNIIVNEFKTKLCINEFNRRIIIPEAPILDERELIKNHRKYLQGHTHDVIIDMAKFIYDKLRIYPIATIHDSLCYIFEDISFKNKTKKVLEEYSKINKISCEIEIIKKLKEE